MSEWDIWAAEHWFKWQDGGGHSRHGRSRAKSWRQSGSGRLGELWGGLGGWSTGRESKEGREAKWPSGGVP